MPRRPRRRAPRAEYEPLDVERVMRGVTRSETGADGRTWAVRSTGGGEKTYRCPGCDQLIAPGTPHLVAWPADHLLGAQAGLADRRHWHSSCWRAGRTPSRRWS